MLVWLVSEELAFWEQVLVLQELAWEPVFFGLIWEQVFWELGLAFWERVFLELASELVQVFWERALEQEPLLQPHCQTHQNLLRLQ